MTERTCPITGHHIAPDRHASPAAAGQLRAALADLPDLMDDLQDLIARRYRFNPRNGPASTDNPLPINIDASNTAWAVRNTVLVWVDELARERHTPVPDTWPTIARALSAWADSMTTTPRGAQALEELLHALNLGRHATDRPAPRHYAGPCTATTTDHDGLAIDCDGELYAGTARTEVQCPKCGAAYPVAERRQWLLDQTADVLATGPDIARALAGDAYGRIKVNLSTIRTWAERGQLLQRGTDRTGRPLYRVGDVLTLATAPRPARPRPRIGRRTARGA